MHLGRSLRYAVATAVVAALSLAGVLAAAPNGRLAASQSTPATAAEAVEFGGLVERPGPLTVADLQQLPHESVYVTFESGEGEQTHSFTGVRLFAVLEHVGLSVETDERNPLLRRYLVVTAKDGYQVVLSGGELDPNFGNAPMLLAWEQDGQPLSAEDGPLRLVVPGDKRGGRYVYGIVRIEVLTIDEPASATS